MLSNIKSVLKNTFIYGLGNLSTKIIGLILLPLYSTHLSIEEYGVMSLLEVSSQILVALFGLALFQAFFRWYFDKNYIEKRNSIFYTTLISLGFLALCMVIGLSFFSGKFSIILLNSAQYSFIIKLMIVSAGLDIIFQSPNTLIRLQEKPILFSTANIIKLVTSLMLTLLFLLHYKQKIEGIYKAQLIGQIIYLLYLSRYILKNITPIFEKTILYEMLSFSFPLMFSTIAAIVLNMSDRYILSFFGTMKDVGQYSLGYKMANTISVFILGSINMALTPMIYKMIDAPNRMRFYSKLMTYYAFGLIIVILGMSFFGKEIIKFFARNPNYWNSYKVIPIISFAILFTMLKDTSMTGLQIMKKSKIIATIVITVSFLNIILDIVFISLFKTIGAAYATLASQLIYFVLILFFAQRVYPIPYELLKIFKMIILGIILYVLASFTNDYSLIIRLTVKSFLILTYPAILYFFRFYEPIEIDRIKGAINKWRDPGTWKTLIKKIQL